MISKTDLQQPIQDLFTATNQHDAQIVGLAAILANLPMVSEIPTQALDAAIEDESKELDRTTRDAASSFAHGILQAARERFSPGVATHPEMLVRGATRGS